MSFLSALSDAVHFILFPCRTMSCHGDCDTVRKNGERQNNEFLSLPFMKLLHITVHTVPKPRRLLRFAYVVALFAAWSQLTTRSQKFRSILAATGYSFIEYAFTRFSTGTSFTSFAQFFANVLYTPILLEVYPRLFERLAIGKTMIAATTNNNSSGSSNSVVTATDTAAFILAYPLNIWLLELIQDRLIFLPVFARNVAWCYCDYSDSACGGVIRWGHGVYWLAMGATVRFGWPAVVKWSDGLF